jgi:hypothetical protein
VGERRKHRAANLGGEASDRGVARHGPAMVTQDAATIAVARGARGFARELGS